MKVSVRIATYNHEQFIAEAINSVLMQNVNFDYEIIIGEDCSTDGTRKIVTDFQKKYPDKIKLILQEQNLGARENIEQILKACQGEYIAVLDGDDYWASPYKLQKQVDFLDKHLECAICFHDAIVFYNDGSCKPWNYCPVDIKEISTPEDLLVRIFIPTSSVIYRHSCLVNELPQEFHKLIMGDWPRHVLIAQYGYIGYINEVMGIYRVHNGGVWSRGSLESVDNQIKRKIADIGFYEVINKYLEYKYDDIIKNQISSRYYFLADLYRSQENWKNMREYLLKGLLVQPFNGNKSFSFLIKAFLISFFPSGYRLYLCWRNRHKLIKLWKPKIYLGKFMSDRF